MKNIIKIVICFLAIFGIFMFLIKIGQYNFISFITGMIWMALWLGICEYLDD
jgi:hypothetical protein